MMTDLPPVARSDTALTPVVAALAGETWLQCCCDCSAFLYPPGELCTQCLGGDLAWKAVDGSGVLLAITQIHRSTESWFQERAPWPIALVQFDAGPIAIAHLQGDKKPEDRVLVRHRLDAAGRPVLVAGSGGPFSAIIGGVCTLTTPNPHGAAERIREALVIVGCGEINVTDGPPLRISAGHQARSLRLDLVSDADIE